MALHVDGAEFYANSEYLCWSIASILAEDQHVFDTKFPVVILPHICMGNDTIKAHVHKTVAKVVSWSLHHAARGIGPTEGPFGEELHGDDRKKLGGQRLAGGWKATYFCFRFDEKARKEVNYFERSYQHSFICMQCMAAKPRKEWNPNLCYKNMHRTAAHRLTNISSSIVWTRVCLFPALFFVSITTQPFQSVSRPEVWMITFDQPAVHHLGLNWKGGIWKRLHMIQCIVFSLGPAETFILLQCHIGWRKTILDQGPWVKNCGTSLKSLGLIPKKKRVSTIY